MERETVVIDSVDIEDLRHFFTERREIEYTKIGRNFFVLGSEKFFYRNKSTQMELIVASITGNQIVVDAVAAAGGTGFFNFNWGSEKNFLGRFRKAINEYKESRGLN